MALPDHKTRIVATVGPACASRDTLEAMVRAGMDVARLNFSHGDFATHARAISELRSAAAAAGRSLAIMADLPGPKIRLGAVAAGRVELVADAEIVLTTREVEGDARRVTVAFPQLPRAVAPGATLFVNDGVVQLAVEAVHGEEVGCRVVVGGEIGSGKGLNVPGLDLGVAAFTAHDRACLAFALEHGVDAVSQSFVAGAADVEAVRAAAAALGHHPFVIAKIERAVALERLDEILAAADGVMVARGDLGVETPIERIAVVQKRIIGRAVAAGRPVITATQMLESMVEHARPTRAEATDVANAILDGTDAVMLSAESAVGAHPVEAVAMLARIAAATEAVRPRPSAGGRGADAVSLLAGAVAGLFERVAPAAVVVPTLSGATARSIVRLRLPAWVVAVSPNRETCQALQFSYGVATELRPRTPESWTDFTRAWIAEHRLKGELALLVEGPSPRNPGANHRLELIELAGDPR